MSRTRTTALAFGCVHGFYMLMVIGSHWLPSLWWMVLPFWAPLLFIFGKNWEGHFGYWGSWALALFGPVPYVLLGCWILALFLTLAFPPKPSNKINDKARA